MHVNPDDVPVSIRPYTDVVAEICRKTEQTAGEMFEFLKLPDRTDFIEALFSSICFGNLGGVLQPSKWVHHDKEWNRWYLRWSHRALTAQDSDTTELMIDRDKLLFGVTSYLKSPDLRSDFLDWYCADTVAYAEYIATYKVFRDQGGQLFTRSLIESGTTWRVLTGYALRLSWALIKLAIWAGIMAASASIAWWAAVVVIALTFWRYFVKYKIAKKFTDMLYSMRSAYDVFQSQTFSWEIAWLELNKARERGAIWPGELYKLVELRRQGATNSV